MVTLPYWAFLIILSLLFVVLERRWPWRLQGTLRAGIWTDALYLGVNGHGLSIVLAPFAAWAAAPVVALVTDRLGSNHLSALPIWAQAAIAFFALDLVQWCVHNLLHRVSFLWTFHKVHHSITTMDWAGSMRFHWMEIVIYRSVGLIPLVLFGFSPEVLFWLAVFSTFMGHLNHSNLKVSLGPLRYLLNHPTMHIWHHDYQMHYSAGCNFGINLSLWDWIFRTAYVPSDEDQPERLGFRGIDGFPRGFVAQEAIPLSMWGRRAKET